MTTRTRKKTVSFSKPFVLSGLDEVLPAGAYAIETDEELLEGISFPAYRRISTLIDLGTRSGHSGRTRMLVIDPNELDAALKRDQKLADTGPDANQKTLPATTEIGRENSDLRDLERCDDEGMVVRPS